MINGRKKGNNYENSVGKLFREWAMPAFDTRESPKDWFCRAPCSGAWNRTHAPGEDLIVPRWFPFAIECKNREKWNFSQVLRGEGQVIEWFKKAEDTIVLPVLLIFTKNYDSDWILLRKDHYGNLVNTKRNAYLNHHSLVLPALDRKGRGSKFVLTSLERLLDDWNPKELRSPKSED